jgi:SAM-dependent methyltransferase
MVEYFHKQRPEISVHQADFCDLHLFANASFDFVLATDNVLDALSHEHRLKALYEAARVLRPAGTLAFSSHNLAYKDAFAGPGPHWSGNLVQFAAELLFLPISLLNYIRVSPLRRATPEYALINDPGHHFACVHYYATRRGVERRLAEAGLALTDAFDYLGRPAADGSRDLESPWLFYIAQKLR